MNKSKAQISIEYLILIAAVLAITALVVAMVTSVFKGQQSDLQYQMCRQASASCALALKQSPDAECASCYDQCMDVRDRTDIMSGEEIERACKNPDSACGMCKRGWASGILMPAGGVPSAPSGPTDWEEPADTGGGGGIFDIITGGGDMAPPPIPT